MSKKIFALESIERPPEGMPRPTEEGLEYVRELAKMGETIAADMEQERVPKPGLRDRLKGFVGR